MDAERRSLFSLSKTRTHLGNMMSVRLSASLQGNVGG